MRKFLFVFIILLGVTANSFADRRYFGRSYLAYTLPAGALEFELWNTGRIGRDMGYFYQFQPRFEFEYGVTDQLSASLYFNFNQITSEGNSYDSKAFGYASSSLELRYRLLTPNEFLVDPALYFEFAYGGNELEYESKIILSKRIGNLITVVNFSSEIEREVVESQNESVFEITGGAMYDVNPNLALGFEFRNHRGYEGIYEEEESQATFIGPTVNLQTESFFITFNFLAQIAGTPSSKLNLDLIHHEQYEFRTILGIEL
jgi:hypothetical protein